MKTETQQAGVVAAVLEGAEGLEKAEDKALMCKHAAAAAAAHDAARSREGGLRTAAGAGTGARGLAAP